MVVVEIVVAAIVLVAIAAFAGRGVISDRWDRGRASDPHSADVGDAAAMMGANPIGLPMHDPAFDRPRD